MNSTVQLVIFESRSLPQGYKALEEISKQGFEPLEFYPHANGVRIIFKSVEDQSKALPDGAKSIMVSLNVIKAMLSQTGNSLKKVLCVVETKNYLSLLELASQFEKIGADILEIRSLRSNPEKNYALFTLDNKDQAAKLIANIDHSFLDASSVVLKDFLGFK